MDRPVLVIAGPTASGKSDASIAIAERIGAEIVVADSMQVYEEMDIGTAKVPLEERRVPHHCIDIVRPDEPFSSALYQEHSRAAIDAIRERGATPLLSGGTGFYIRAAIDDYRFPKGEQVDNPIRDELRGFLEANGVDALWERLRSVDPDSAADIHPNDSKRVMRALELHEGGESYHEQRTALASIPQLYDAVFICLDVDKDVLSDRIRERVRRMRDIGLVDEVRHLLEAGLRDSITSSSAIGYKEIVRALDGETTLDEAFSDIETATRRYAKRQRTWFRGDPRYRHIDATGLEAHEVAESVIAMISDDHGHGRI